MRVRFTILIFILSCFGSHSLWAQSAQYKRDSKPAPAAKKEAKAPAKKGDDKATPSAASKDKPSSGKLDIEDLEKRYWAPKDTEFKVVQNRKYTKKDRLNLTFMGGILFNDPFISASNYSISGAYYKDEFHALEVRLETYNNALGEGGKSVVSKGGHPDVNYEKMSLGVTYSYVPFYGKISVLDTKIIYFDMALSAGLSMVRYEQQTKAGNGSTKTTPALNLDISQQYFIHQNWAFRFDVRTRIYKEQRLLYDDSSDLGSKLQVNTNIMFGVTYFH